MTDVKALAILSEQIDNFRNIQKPPTSFDQVEAYGTTLKKTCGAARGVVANVKSYIELIEGKLKELSKAMQGIIKQNQDAIQNVFSSFEYVEHGNTWRHDNGYEQLKRAHALQNITRELMNDRLNDLIQETELACGKVKDAGYLNSSDVDALMGCLDNWKKAKSQSYAEEKRLEEEERRRKEEEARKRKEAAERRKKEEEERRKREEEERKRREKEEAARRAEEERLRREEEERLHREEEERRKREEEERKQREKEEAERKALEEQRRLEEEERLRKEEEERKKREEEERIQREAEEKRLREEEEARRKKEERRKREEAERKRREEERLRLEKERKEKERLQREAEEKARRLDPNNWKPIVYERPCDEVDGRREYHGGINCVMTSPEGGIQKDDIECYASDEIDSVITVLDDDEKPVSSLIDVESKKESLHSEVPSRVYVPHTRMLQSGDELVIKMSKDGSDWMTSSPLQTTLSMSEVEKTARMAGVAVNDFTTLKLIVVSRPRSQTIVVDKPGLSVFSAVDNQVKLIVPRDTFESKTEMRMMVQSVSGDTLNGLIKDNSSLENVLSVSSIITLMSKKAPRKSVEVDLLKSSTKQGTTSSTKFQRGKFYQLIACKDKAWRLADVEYKGQQNNVTVTLPVGREKATIMELEVPANCSKDVLPGIAETLYTSVNKTSSVMIVKQMGSNPKKAAVRIVRKEDITFMLDYLENIGYNDGPGVSGEFKIKEGQAIRIVCSGNIETDDNKDIDLEYMSYKGGSSAMINLRVKDIYKQKDLQWYVGSVRCMLLTSKHSTTIAATIEMTITLPKLERAKSAVNFVRVRFPYYLTSLASYLAKSIRKEESLNWQSVLKTLMGEKGFEIGLRNAKRKFEELNDDENMFKTVLLDWMRSQQRQTDKLVPIMDALKRNGYATVAHDCEEHITFMKANLSDGVIKEIASGATKATRDVGRDLGLPGNIIDKCMRDYPNDSPEQMEALLIEWRETDDVLRQEDIQRYLRKVTAS